MQFKPIKSIYIHIPFCKNICSYCDFCKNYYDKKIVNKYLEELEKEIKNNYKNESIKTLYIGGGTPSCLDKDELNKLFNIINSIRLKEDYEFTFECNFEDINDELLIYLKENKVNRLSIGIQTFNDKFKNILKRDINKEKMIDAIILSKKYFNNINIDLIYAIFNQSLDDLKNDLEIIKKLDINHISTYSLIIENHTVLKINGIKEISDEIQSNMYYYIKNYLEKLGFKHYEISNFSKDGYESKHNITYWNNENYYGFGAGASGFLNNKRYTNTKSVFNYINGYNKKEYEELSDNDLLLDEIMLNLRKIEGINKKDFINKYGNDVSYYFDYDKLRKNKYIIETDKNIMINDKYLFVSNDIIIDFLNSFKEKVDKTM